MCCGYSQCLQYAWRRDITIIELCLSCVSHVQMRQWYSKNHMTANSFCRRTAQCCLINGWAWCCQQRRKSHRHRMEASAVTEWFKNGHCITWSRIASRRCNSHKPHVLVPSWIGCIWSQSCVHLLSLATSESIYLEYSLFVEMYLQQYWCHPMQRECTCLSIAHEHEWPLLKSSTTLQM